MQENVNLDKVQLISDFSQQTVYLMGSSFVLGSMFTLFILLVLDWVRRDKNER
jgi:hypothetical protein